MVKTIEKIFATELEFREELKKRLKPKRFVEKMLHEKAHFRKAEMLGYSPLYKVVLKKNNSDNWELEGAYVRIKRKQDSNPKDRIKIALAPKYPSKEDIYLAIKYSIKSLFKK